MAQEGLRELQNCSTAAPMVREWGQVKRVSCSLKDYGWATSTSKGTRGVSDIQWLLPNSGRQKGKLTKCYWWMECQLEIRDRVLSAAQTPGLGSPQAPGVQGVQLLEDLKSAWSHLNLI